MAMEQAGKPTDATAYRQLVHRRLVIFLGIVATIAILSLFAKDACEAPTYPMKMEAGGPFSCAEYWVNRYQTLIGAAATLLAAAIALFAVRRQVQVSENIESYRISQEAAAARSVLPFALSAICDYAEHGMRALDRHRAAPGTALELREFPSSVIPTLKEAVRFSTGSDQRRIADLITTAQVVVARSQNRMSVSYQPQMLIDFADLYERASQLFDFGRISMDRHLVSAEHIRGAFRIARVQESDWPELLTEMLDSREAARRRRNE